MLLPALPMEMVSTSTNTSIVPYGPRPSKFFNIILLRAVSKWHN